MLHNTVDILYVYLSHMFLPFREVKNQWSNGHLIKSCESADKLYRINKCTVHVFAKKPPQYSPPPKIKLKKINYLSTYPLVLSKLPLQKNKF